jgi:hypothetical protein
MRLPPDPFICSACDAPIYDEWGGCLIEVYAHQDPQWWSDGTHISQGEAPRGEFEICPRCDSIMPRAFIKRAQQLYKEGKPYPYRDLVLTMNDYTFSRADEELDYKNQVRVPEIIHWAQMDYNGQAPAITDPVLLTLVVAAMLKQANGNYSMEAEFQLAKPEINWHMTQTFPKTFKVFLAKVKNHEITEFSSSQAFGGTIASKVGYFRFNMIVAELARNVGDFDFAILILRKMENQLAKIGDVAKPDDPKDRDKYSSAWPAEALKGFIKVSKRMIRNENPNLALVASIPSEVAWNENNPFPNIF